MICPTISHIVLKQWMEAQRGLKVLQNKKKNNNKQLNFNDASLTRQSDCIDYYCSEKSFPLFNKVT